MTTADHVLEKASVARAMAVFFRQQNRQLLMDGQVGRWTILQSTGYSDTYLQSLHQCLMTYCRFLPADGRYGLLMGDFFSIHNIRGEKGRHILRLDLPWRRGDSLHFLLVEANFSGRISLRLPSYVYCSSRRHLQENVL